LWCSFKANLEKHLSCGIDKFSKQETNKRSTQVKERERERRKGIGGKEPKKIKIPQQ
jgi:hypothetical protein